MDRQFNSTIRATYADVVTLLTHVNPWWRVYLTANPSNYFESNGDDTWTSAVTGEVVTASTLAHQFANKSINSWVFEYGPRMRRSRNSVQDIALARCKFYPDTFSFLEPSTTTYMPTDPKTDHTPGIIYSDLVLLFTDISYVPPKYKKEVDPPAKLYLKSTPDDYYVPDGRNTWLRVKTHETLTPAQLAHVFADVPTTDWVWKFVHYIYKELGQPYPDLDPYEVASSRMAIVKRRGVFSFFAWVS